MIRQIKYSTTVRDRVRRIYREREQRNSWQGWVIELACSHWNEFKIRRSLSVPFRSLGGQSNPAQISHFPLLGGVNQHLADWMTLEIWRDLKHLTVHLCLAAHFGKKAFEHFRTVAGTVVPQKKHPNQLQCLPLNALPACALVAKQSAFGFVVGRRRR